jgi:ribonucleoside-diphosphate reductase alpha chain
LLDYESCNLGSINPARMLDKNGGNIDWEKLKKTARMGVRFLDNVIVAGKYPVRPIVMKTVIILDYCT